MEQINEIIDAADDLMVQLLLRSISVNSGLNYYEESIGKYNFGQGISPSMTEFIESYLDENGVIKDVTCIGLTCVSEALKEIGKKYWNMLIS